MATMTLAPVVRSLAHELATRRKYFELEGIGQRYRTVRHWNRLHGVYAQLVNRIGEDEALSIWQQIERDNNYPAFLPGDKRRIGMATKERVGDPTIDWAEENNLAEWSFDEPEEDEYDGTDVLALMQEDEELLGSWQPVHYLNEERIAHTIELIRKDLDRAATIRRIGAADRKAGRTEALKEDVRQWKALEAQLWEDYATYDALYEKPWIARTIVRWAKGDEVDELWLERIAAVICKALHITQYAERYAPRYAKSMETLDAFWKAYTAPLPEVHDNYVERRSDHVSIAEVVEAEDANELDEDGVHHRPRTELAMHLRHLGWTMTRKATAGLPQGKTSRAEILYGVKPEVFYGYVRARRATHKMELSWEQLIGWETLSTDTLVRAIALALWSDATCGTQYEHKLFAKLCDELGTERVVDLLDYAYHAYYGNPTKTDAFYANLLEKELREMQRRRIGVYFQGGVSPRPTSRPSAVR